MAISNLHGARSRRTLLRMRRIGLASGVLPEHTGLTVAQTALACGYSDAGVMVRPENWRDDELQAMCALRDEHGLGYIDVEVLWIPSGAKLDESHKKVADVGLALGADNMLCVSDEPDPKKLAPALRQITDWCGGRLKPVLEFLRITRVQSLKQATALLDACDGHDFGILIDTLHLMRSGEMTADLGDLARYPYVQLCDGRVDCGDEYDQLLNDAVDGRMAPGEGEIPLAGIMARLPADLPVSVEVRSKDYRERFIDPVARAGAILKATRTFLDQYNL